MIKIKKLLKKTLTLIFIIFFGIFLVRYPNLSFLGVKEGFEICFGTLVPSLFPFVFFASFIINSRAANILGKIFAKISEKIFFLPPETAPVIFLSMIGGYPVGAKGISELFEKKIINSKQAERMLKFCVNAGPAFILGVIGNNLIKNLRIAGIILASQIISALIIAIILAFLEKDNNKNYKNNNLKIKKICFSEALINSCESASSAIINMCFLVIIFNILYIFLYSLQIIYFCDILLSGLGLPQEISKCFFQIILEVTKSCQMISNYGVFPQLLAFATSWGGLCVHFQVFSILKNLKINYLNFFVFRFLNALLSSFLTFLLIKMQNISLNINSGSFPQTSTNILGSIALVLCCLIFLFDINFKKKYFN
jgi:sporulation integral membrane protein YlbJ